VNNYLATLLERTRDFITLDFRWHGVTWVARELLARRTLSGREVRKVYDAALVNYFRQKEVEGR
jgi:hypothetical protein